MQSSGLSRVKFFIAALAIPATLLAGLAHASHAGDRASDALASALDAVFESTLPVSMTPVAIAPPDLNDGRSPVGKRWQHSFEAFAASDRDQPPAAGGVVFVGSSSMSLWPDLQAQFPTHNIVQRGLGGARMADCARHVDRLVSPYRPHAVVVYAGDNDLAEGVSPEDVLSAYTDFVQQVHDALPRTRIVFVSIKPSPSRASLIPLVRRANSLVAAHTAHDALLDYVDVFTPMLDDTAQARAELFRADALHLNTAGYALWAKALANHLD